MAIAAVAGCEVEADDRLIELDYGEWDGRPLGDIDAREWAAWRADPSFAPPGGESLVAVTARVESFCRERLAESRGDRCDRGESRFADQGCGVLGARRRRARDVADATRAGAITDIGARPDGSGYLSSFNDGAHLFLSPALNRGLENSLSPHLSRRRHGYHGSATGEGA